MAKLRVRLDAEDRFTMVAKLTCHRISFSNGLRPLVNKILQNDLP
jgi:hypothetical protein